MKERPAIDSKIWVGSEPPRAVASISRFFTRLFRKVFPEKSFFLPAEDLSRVGVADVGSHDEIESSKRILSSLSISKPGEPGDDLLCAGSDVAREEVKSNDLGALIVGEPWEKAIWRTMLPLRRGRAVGDIGVRRIRAFGEPVVPESDGGVWNWGRVRWSRPREWERGVDGVRGVEGARGVDGLGVDGALGVDGGARGSAIASGASGAAEVAVAATVSHGSEHMFVSFSFSLRRCESFARGEVGIRRYSGKLLTSGERRTGCVFCLLPASRHHGNAQLGGTSVGACM